VSGERHTLHVQAITGMPWLVPVPARYIFIFFAY